MVTSIADTMETSGDNSNITSSSSLPSLETVETVSSDGLPFNKKGIPPRFPHETELHIPTVDV